MIEEKPTPNFSKLCWLSNAMFRNIKKTEEIEKEPSWWQHNIFATTTKDLLKDGTVLYPKGTKVRIWMVSRFGDVGITGNLTDTATGYDLRGVDADEDLTDVTIELKN